MVEDEAMISSPLFVFFRFGEEICFLLFGLRVPLFLFLSARAPQRESESEARGSGEWILARGIRRERERATRTWHLRKGKQSAVGGSTPSLPPRQFTLLPLSRRSPRLKPGERLTPFAPFANHGGIRNQQRRRRRSHGREWSQHLVIGCRRSWDGFESFRRRRRSLGVRARPLRLPLRGARPFLTSAAAAAAAAARRRRAAASGRRRAAAAAAGEQAEGEES